MPYVERAAAATQKKETKTMIFGNICGVDFRSDDTESYRSPDSVNMYRSKLGVWETHPGFRSIGNIGKDIYGIERFSYINKYGEANEQVLIHAGTSMYLWNNYPENFNLSDLTEIYNGMNADMAKYITFNNNLIIADGEHIFYYDGDIFDTIENIAFVPQTWTGKSPDAKSGTEYQQRNFLTGYFIEGFTADNTTVNYLLSLKDLDDKPADAWSVINGEEVHYTEVSTTPTGKQFTLNRTTGEIKFGEAPQYEITGVENLFIKASKTSKGYADKINKCTEILVFDNRLFLTGNPEYPNTIFWSGNADFSYFGEIMYSDNAGTGSAPVIALQLLSDSRFVSIKKDTNQDGTYAVWATQTMDSDVQPEIYSPSKGNSTVGCTSRNAHAVFVDDNVFLSFNGLNAISRSLSLSYERNIEHRSTLVDVKLLSEDLEKAIIEPHSKWLYILFPNGHCYIADSSARTSKVSSFTEYEWAYLENIGAYEGQIEDENGEFKGGEFRSPTFLKSLSVSELYFGANGKLFKFYFDEQGTDGFLNSQCYNFNGRAINDYVDTSFSWFDASNRYKTLIRKYNDLYCDTRSLSNVEVLYRTEKSHLSDSKVLNYSTNVFSFADINFDNFSFNTLPVASFAMRKLKAKKFRRLQLRIRSAGINCPIVFKSVTVDAWILNKKLK